MIGPQKSWICMSFENSTTKKIIQNGTLNIHNTKAKSNKGNQKIHDVVLKKKFFYEHVRKYSIFRGQLHRCTLYY